MYWFEIIFYMEYLIIYLFFKVCMYNKKVLRFDELKKEVKKAIKKVKRENYKKYFLYAYKKNELRKSKRGVSTLVRKPKIYKS